MNALASLPEQLASIAEAARVDARARTGQVAEAVGLLAARPLDEHVAGRISATLARLSTLAVRPERALRRAVVPRYKVRQITQPLRSEPDLNVSRTGDAA